MSTIDEFVTELELLTAKFPPLPRGVEVKISGNGMAVSISVRDLSERLQSLFTSERWIRAGGTPVSYRRFQKNLDKYQIDFESAILYDFFRQYPTEASYEHLFGSKKQVAIIRTILTENGQSWNPY